MEHSGIIYMEFIYLLLNGSEWEDIIVFLSKEDAIEQSKKNPLCKLFHYVP